MKNNKKIVFNPIWGHSRVSLSGIFNAFCGINKETSFCNDLTTIRRRSPITTFGDDLSVTNGLIARGFTLIELLVVVLIIGILAAVALPQYQKAVEKARATQAIMLMSTLEKAVDAWVLEHGIQEANDFLDKESSEKLDIDIPCQYSNGRSSCDINNDQFVAYAGCYTSDNTCDIYMSRQHSSSYYPLVAFRDENGKWTHKCGYFDEVSKAVCKGLEAQGWEAKEEWDW